MGGGRPRLTKISTTEFPCWMYQPYAHWSFVASGIGQLRKEVQSLAESSEAGAMMDPPTPNRVESVVRPNEVILRGKYFESRSSPVTGVIQAARSCKATINVVPAPVV